MAYYRLVKLPWARRRTSDAVARPGNTISVTDPRLVELLSLGGPSLAGITVTEQSAMGVSAFFRAVALISGTIATLPLRTLRDTGDGMRQRMSSVFDSPGDRAPLALTPFSWLQLVVVHLLLHGNAYLRHHYDMVGRLIALEPIHPLVMSVELPEPGDAVRPEGGRWYRYTLADGTQARVDRRDLTHIMGLSLDGIVGASVLTLARNGVGIAIAGQNATAKLYSGGAATQGVLVPVDDDMDPADAKEIRREINRTVTGWENAGSVPVVNRRLQYHQISMSMKDAQFLESRAFEIREIARWFGIPPHLLMETSAASNWGTGIEQQNLGLSRFNLVGWTTTIEHAFSRLLPSPRWVEFDFAALERPDPQTEDSMLLARVKAGVMTIDEYRAIRNLPPLGTSVPAPAPTGVPA